MKTCAAFLTGVMLFLASCGSDEAARTQAVTTVQALQGFIDGQKEANTKIADLLSKGADRLVAVEKRVEELETEVAALKKRIR